LTLNLGERREYFVELLQGVRFVRLTYSDSVSKGSGRPVSYADSSNTPHFWQSITVGRLFL
jgi:hypothetical protein